MLTCAGLLPPGTATRLVDRSGLQVVVEVQPAAGPPMMAKWARPRPDGEQRTIGRELTVYALAPSLPGLAAALPRCLHVDHDVGVLVMEAVDGAPGGGAADAARLGSTLAAVHLATSGIELPLPVERPWILGVLVPGRWRPPGTDAVLAIGTERARLRAVFAALEHEVVPSCLVHGDLKPANWIVRQGGAPVLIDWETASVGDPAWDLAGVLAAFGHPGEENPSAAAAFLGAYLTGRPPAPARRLVLLAARLTGARLVQSALEQAAADGPQDVGVRRLVGAGLAHLENPATLVDALAVPVA